jgi:transcriptional regulator with XRE-family HTH domain
MRYGKALKLARAARGLSQKELAERAGMDASYISLLESEKRVPTVTTLEALAKALSIPLHLLVLLGADESELRGLTAEQGAEIASSLLGILVASQSKADPDAKDGD